MIRVGIVGATGYGGRELLRLLGVHPEAGVVAVASTTAPGEPLGEVLPAFAGFTDLVFEEFDAKALGRECDVVFVGVPGTESMALVAELHGAGARVIDLGPDFRLKDAETFSAHYGKAHAAPDLLPEAVYGLPAYHREGIRQAQIVATPGCYPISVILPLRPLVGQSIDTTVPVVADCISGVSGAGRSLNEAYHFPEMNENVKAYNVARHRHTPEIEQELRYQAKVQFTPHVAPLTRGILSTLTVRVAEPFDAAAAYAERYEEELFIRVLPEGKLPEVKHVRGSNICDIGWVMDDRTGNLIVVSAVDNLMGGTAGMAVQCMNLMFGLDEGAGLAWGGMAP